MNIAGFEWFTILIAVVGIAVSLALYFLPSIIAISRRHRNAAAIVLVNLFLGWSGVGWIITLIWSLTK
ncbi:MAG: superinfection immunity protein [Dehalococcoidia bacterium]|nr:superinfection immunity protein [Dehalococcoidia bacterium]